MWGMASVLDKRLNYVGNDLEIWEMAKIFGNGLDIWGSAKEFEKRNKYVAIDLTILNMA